MDAVHDPWEMTVGDDGGVAVSAAPARAAPKRLEGSPQQEAFWRELREGTTHIVLEARAGTGKSSSCREGMHRLLDRDRRLAIRYCCFNKKVADEFAAGCPAGVDVGTMHRFGLQALRSAFNCQVDKDKSYALLDSAGGRDLKGYYRRAIVKLVGLAKNHGMPPPSAGMPNTEWSAYTGELDNLVEHYDIECYRERDMVIDRAMDVLEASAKMSNIVDFDDMLWLCTIHPVRFPGVDFLFIDECQDTNPVQHAMAAGLSGSGRTVVVGDPFQSIYAFRGADSESMPKLKAMLDATVMPLTMTFRCPRTHVELARQLVPDFECAADAPEGTVSHSGEEAIDMTRPGDLVLCRANAPIIRACLRKIAALEPAIVRGRAIGDSLLAVARKVGLTESRTIADFTRGLMKWKNAEVSRLDVKDGCDDLIEQVMDKAAGLDAIASACSTPADVPAAILLLFSDDDAAQRVTFSTVHRAKGSEARDVTYIQIPFGAGRRQGRPTPQWELDQRRNLRYVALTRSLDRLTLVTPGTTNEPDPL